MTRCTSSYQVRTFPTSTECCETLGEIVATRSPTCKSNWKSDTLNWKSGMELHLKINDVVEMARLYIMTDCNGSFERFSEWGLIRPKE
jgi:hypothetical protein